MLHPCSLLPAPSWSLVVITAQDCVYIRLTSPPDKNIHTLRGTKFKHTFIASHTFFVLQFVIMDSYSSPGSVKRKLKQILTVFCFKIREHDLPELKKCLSVFNTQHSSEIDDNNLHLSYALNFQDDHHLHHFAFRSFSAKLPRRLT